MSLRPSATGSRSLCWPGRLPGIRSAQWRAPDGANDAKPDGPFETDVARGEILEAVSLNRTVSGAPLREATPVVQTGYRPRCHQVAHRCYSQCQSRDKPAAPVAGPPAPLAGPLAWPPRAEAIEGHLGVSAGASQAEAFARMTPPVCDALLVRSKPYEELRLPSVRRPGLNRQLLGAFVPGGRRPICLGVQGEPSEAR